MKRLAPVDRERWPRNAANERAELGPWPRRLAAPVIAWLAGLLVVFAPGIASGFGRLLGGLGDVRLINFTLEHGYRWLAGYHLHRDFWSPPIFYPQTGVSAYTDVLLGVGPFYWVFRALGVRPDVAFHLWVMVIWSLNFAVCYWLLRRWTGLGTIAASCGSFLFAFGAWRQLNVIHEQLIPNFFLLASLCALLALFRPSGSRPVTRPRGWLWVGVFFAGLVLQAWTAFYPLYFFGLALGAATLWALAARDTRRPLVAGLARHIVAWLVLGLLAAAAVYPLAVRYARAAEEVGLRSYPREKVPRPMSWLLMGQTNRLYGGLQREGGPFHELRSNTHSNGAGPLTTVIALAGLWGLRRRPGVRLVVLAVATLVLVSTTFGDLSLWRLVHRYLPGAAAMRAVGRIGMVMILPVALGMAAFVDRRLRDGRYALVVALGALCLAEQLHAVEWRSRDQLREHVAEIASRVSPDCEAFLLVSRGRQRYAYADEDAAWVALATGIPTVNGRYGNRPPGWGLHETHLLRPRRERRVQRKLDEWSERHGLDPDRICWVETRAPD